MFLKPVRTSYLATPYLLAIGATKSVVTIDFTTAGFSGSSPFSDRPDKT